MKSYLKKATGKIKDLVEYGIPVGIGSGLGYATSLYESWKANLLSSSLRDMDFLQAILAGYGKEWLFYNYPLAMTLLVVGSSGGILGLLYWAIKNRYNPIP
ncbi:MAG: hypothetical protein J7K98_04180 [Candidatus Aenigmarchaeota archaeon]|nr:hypothetical protein [Candidatus Aenigmarchaeota archaeon]